MFTIRKIIPSDERRIASIIQAVMPEFSADGPGFAIHDAEVSSMCSAYSIERAAYYVILTDGVVNGGGGISQLIGSSSEICELKKMYFMPEIRGKGFARKLMEKLLGEAKEMGYKSCYIETLERMDAANKLYQNFGFTKLSKPLGNTGHFGCNTWYSKSL